MNTRLVTDSRNQVLVLFGGDGQSHYLADTWLFDLRTRKWRDPKLPEDRKHGQDISLSMIRKPDGSSSAGGYNRRDLEDMWAYDAREDRWRRLAGKVPVGFYLTADIAPEQRLIVLATSTRKTRRSHDVQYPLSSAHDVHVPYR